MALELYDWQAKYIKNCSKSFISTANLGTGKTAMTIKHYDRYNHGNPLLIVCTAAKRNTGDWQREIGRFLDYTPPFLEVISYEGMAKHWQRYTDIPNLTIVADECHYLANATTKRSKAFLKIAKSPNTVQWILLSGTPTPNQWRSGATYAILTGLVRNKTEYWRRFVIEDRSRGFPIYLGYREESLLNRWWSTISRHLERPLLPFQNIPVELPLSKTTSAIQRRAIRERLTPTDEPLDSPSKLFVYLRQLAIKERLTALRNVLDGTDENVVVWYNFNSERGAILKLLAKTYPERKIYEQSGQNKNLPKRDDWSSIANSVTLAQYQSASAAIELTYASVNVYLSPSTSYANYEQSKGRTRRTGQTKTVLYYYIAIKNTPDKDIWKSLQNRRDFSTALLQKSIDNLSYL